MDKHRANLLAATQQQLEKELSSCAARGDSPVVGDDAVAEPEPEQDSPGCSVDLETSESRAQVVYDACRLGGKKRRLVTVQDYPWKFVSPQLLDCKGTEIMYPVEDDRDQWWARRLEDTVNHHRDLAVYKPTLWMLCGGCSRRWKRRSVVSVLREKCIIIAAPEAVFPQIMRINARMNYIYA